jgi:hypothetical protein
MMAGYGLADVYGSLTINPVPVTATEAASSNAFDSLFLRGTAIGILSRSSLGWSYINSMGPPVTFRTWNDSRENISKGDKVIYMEPNTRELVMEGATAIYSYPDIPSSAGRGVLVYGLHSEDAKLPYYTVEYLLGGTRLSSCAPGTLNLLRAESRNDDLPDPVNRKPIIPCVRDFQVAFGLDAGQNMDGVIDTWDNGGGIASAYDRNTLKKRLKQVRVYVLAQSGNRDPDYLYENPESPEKPDTIRVGEKILGTGRDITLTPEQRRYHWKVLAVSITPRNLR